MTKKYKEIEEISAYELIRPVRFRLISHDCLEIPGGVDELPVLLTLKDSFAAKLPFSVPSAGRIHGFAGVTETVAGYHGVRADYGKTGALRQITMNDWGDTFVFVLEYKNGDEKAFYVKNEEVLALLTACRRPPYLSDNNYGGE